MEIRFDRAVLFVELSQIRDKVFDHIGVWQRVDLCGLALSGDAAETGKSVDAVDVHCARTTDAFTARTAEGQGGIHFILDAD